MISSSYAAATTTTMHDETHEVDQDKSLVFDFLKNNSKIPQQFIWPDDEKPCPQPPPPLHVPPIDLNDYLSGDPLGVSNAIRLVNEACRKHGFFLVVNHGIDSKLIDEAHKNMDFFFGKPLLEKERAKRKVGDYCGYASSFTSRFSCNLPWKETLSFRYSAEFPYSDHIVQSYILNVMGQEYTHFGNVYQKYCEEMSKLSLSVMELLGESLGVGRAYFREFFEGNDSIMRLNYYPICQKPDLTLGTGPHCDPTSLTILHQDDVGGLQVFVDQKWHSIPSNTNAFVVNIGDTFMVMSNGTYKSCLHRAVVNCTRARKSLAFFLCPNKDKIVRPPKELITRNPARRFPDFTWPVFLEFTQKHYRADKNTLDAFLHWLLLNT
ncbi:hypothetical protein HAX54_005161 [Datura stramonium]|uniref:Fe2OG dioxygenase domain-containing protein n=1 Tax=Datura stramonium TaxID=4076 RepID=A0ABS8T8Z9_DATST|nr:hypothetical protein [Datura stramonium]